MISKPHFLTSKSVFILVASLIVGQFGYFEACGSSNLLNLYLIVFPLTIIQMVYCSRFIFHEDGTFKKDSLDSKILMRLFLMSGTSSLLLEALTLAGARTASPFDLADWNIKRLLVFFWAAWSVQLFVLEYLHGSALFPRAMNRICSIWKRHKFLFVLLALTAVFIFLIIAIKPSHYSIGLLLLLCLAVILVAALRVKRVFTLEGAFVVLSLLLGSVLMFSFPAGNLFSWDDEVHYNRALSLSYISDVEYTKSDRMMIDLFHQEDGIDGDASFGRWSGGGPNWDAAWSISDNDAYYHELDANNGLDGLSVEPGMSSTALQLYAPAYLPAAAGIWMARLFGFSFTLSFALGRLFTFIAYTFVVAAAIKVTPRRKGLFFAVGLLPTNLFLAANYSYDWCVTSFLLLGFALAFRAFESEGVLSLHDFFLILAAFALGLFPKAVYVPIVAILFFMPSTKFKSLLHRILYYATGIIFAIIMVGTILVPMVATGGGGAGDSRGGSEVNSSQQVKLTLENPGNTIKIIDKFIVRDYLTPVNIDSSLANYAYLGSLQNKASGFLCLPLVLLVGLALTECEEQAWPLLNWRSRLAVAVLCLLTVFLSCLALYFSFTAVGSETVAGMQSRYLIPLLLPFLCVTCGTNCVRTRVNLSRDGILIASFGFLYIVCTWLLLLSRLY